MLIVHKTCHNPGRRLYYSSKPGRWFQVTRPRYSLAVNFRCFNTWHCPDTPLRQRHCSLDKVTQTIGEEICKGNGCKWRRKLLSRVALCQHFIFPTFLQRLIMEKQFTFKWPGPRMSNLFRMLSFSIYYFSKNYTTFWGKRKINKTQSLNWVTLRIHL